MGWSGEEDRERLGNSTIGIWGAAGIEILLAPRFIAAHVFQQP